MRKIQFVALALVVVVASSCASMKSDSGLGQAKADIIRPTLEVIQISGLPAAARHVEGGVPINYRVRISNTSGQAVTLKNLTLQSQGFGAYEIEPTSRAFSLTVNPDATEAAEFWIPATTSGSLMGGNGPVTLRAIAHFDSPAGQFDQVVVQQVNAMASGGEKQ